ncbi:MAG: ankyrin repeat domain-containing protein [Treponema sp.]|nr:ankyrin repeat domain-containing protein [Treponema sp.]
MKKIICLLMLLNSLPLLFAFGRKDKNAHVLSEPVQATLTDEGESSEEDAAEETEEEMTPEAEEPESVPVASKDEPIPEIEPYKSVYLLDYAELDSEDDAVPLSSFDPNAGRYQYIENADVKDSDGRTLLMKAARKGNISMIENLIYSEADVNATDNDGWTALMFGARFQNNPKVIELLLEAGANASMENNYGITALLLAAGFSENKDVVLSLLENRSVAEKEVLAAFIYAITNEASVKILQLFVDKGIAINAPYEGKTPLMYAAETNKETATIGWLMEHGARTRYKTASGQTAFDYARANKRLPRDDVYWSLNTNGASR